MPDIIDPNAPPAPQTNPPTGAPPGAPKPEGAAPPAPAPRRAPAEGITAQGLTERLKRERETERRRVLAELGIDDPAKAKESLTDYQRLKQESEERKRAEMSEVERYKADLERYKAEAEAARSEARDAKAAVDYEKRDSLIRQTASKYVDDRFVRTARVEFKAYVESLSPSQQAKLTDQQMEVWMRRFAKENPDLARKPGDTSKPNPVPVLKKPLTNGSTVRRMAKPGDVPAPPANGGDPAAPGGKHVREMSPAEVNEFARKNGLRSYKAAPINRPSGAKSN